MRDGGKTSRLKAPFASWRSDSWAESAWFCPQFEIAGNHGTPVRYPSLPMAHQSWCNFAAIRRATIAGESRDASRPTYFWAAGVQWFCLRNFTAIVVWQFETGLHRDWGAIGGDRECTGFPRFAAVLHRGQNRADFRPQFGTPRCEQSLKSRFWNL